MNHDGVNVYEYIERVVMREGKYTVYKHTSPEGKVYIGCTSMNPDRRWGSNGWGYKFNSDMYNDIRKFGWDNFNHDILASSICEHDAYELEKHYISEYDSTNPKRGYNIATGGKGACGVALNTERKTKLIEAISGENHYLYRKHLPEETRRKLSEAHKGARNPNYGKPRSEETRRKIADSNSKKVRCIETGEIYSSITLASASKGISSPSGISAAIKGRYKTSGGYHWECVE